MRIDTHDGTAAVGAVPDTAETPRVEAGFTPWGTRSFLIAEDTVGALIEVAREARAVACELEEAFTLYEIVAVLDSSRMRLEVATIS